jgi:hypothetical protein
VRDIGSIGDLDRDAPGSGVSVRANTAHRLRAFGGPSTDHGASGTHRRAKANHSASRCQSSCRESHGESSRGRRAQSVTRGQPIAGGVAEPGRRRFADPGGRGAAAHGSTALWL